MTTEVEGHLADVRVVQEGTYTNIFLVQLQTTDAHEWVDCYVSDDHVMLGNSLVVEGRYVEDLLYGMQEDGLTLEAFNSREGVYQHFTIHP